MTTSIAIVGMGCCYPDARNPRELWENVLSQRRAFRRLPRERLNLEDYHAPHDQQRPDATYAVEAAVIEGYEFDRTRFRVVGSTYRAADLAHWLALDVADAALADAGFVDGKGLPRDSTGVLVGNTLTGEFSRANALRLRWPYVRNAIAATLKKEGYRDQQLVDLLANIETDFKAPFPEVGDESLAGGLSNTIAGRICNHFDLKGGGHTVDAACASSLLAIANACSALSAGDLDVAVAGGVDLSLDPFELVGFARVGALAADDMRVYDKHPTGFLPGEGCAMVVLMRADDARQAGRLIHAVIRGWGISSDGAGGITRPEVDGQRLALERAYRRAGFGIDTVGYFEGHGTGTSVGDAAELEALSVARRAAGAATPAAIGSIKANIGHTKAAAGVAGIIKATFVVDQQMIPPATACRTPHPTLQQTPQVLRAPERGEVWPLEQPCRAGVSAMGFGGINTHVVIENAPGRRRRGVSPNERMLLSAAQDAELLLLAAPDRAALAELCRRVGKLAPSLSRSELSDLAALVARKYAKGSCRAAVVARRPHELAERLEQICEWIAAGVDARIDSANGVMLATDATPPRVGLLFPGQGSPVNLDGGAWPRRFDDVRRLYESVEHPTSGDATPTEIAQPAIIAASLAGLQLLDRLGLEADVAVGHSLGELTAYHWARSLNEKAVMQLAAARGAAMAELPGDHGAMAAVAAPANEVETLCSESGAVISGFNSPLQTIVSGETEAVAVLVKRAVAQGLRASQLRVSHAFHSALVADARPGLRRALNALKLSPLAAPVYSTITGALLSADDDPSELLMRQLVSPVRLTDAVRAANSQVDLWLEVGPGSVLSGLAAELVDKPALSLDAAGESLTPMLTTIGALFAMGAPLRAESLYEDRFVRPFDLDRQPKFFVNPCQLGVGGQPVDGIANAVERHAEASSAQASASNREVRWSEPHSSGLSDRRLVAAETDQPRVEIDAAHDADLSTLETVKQLVAARAEIPLESVREDDRLLSDLHFSSITVGQLSVEAAKALQLAPPAMPTAAANVTVGEMAAALEELLATAAAQEPSDAPRGETEGPPAGVDAWTRAFMIELVERPLPQSAAYLEPKGWRLLAPKDHHLRRRLQEEFTPQAPGEGVLVCLLPGREDEAIGLLLEAARHLQVAGEQCQFALLEQDGCGAAFARSFYLEYPQFDVAVVQTAADQPRAIEWLLDEIATGVGGFAEAHYDDLGVRREPVLQRLPLEREDPPLPLDPDDVLLVTGGGKGIGAECALQLARASGAKLALLGRSRPEADEALAVNLERMRSGRLQVEYYSADVADRDAVRRAVSSARDELGVITGVLHAAGTNVPQSLATLDCEAFRRTMLPKVDGLRNVLDSVAPDQMRLLVAFGSIIARTGMRGNADYAVANARLAEMVDHWQRRHPHCNCLTMESSIWAGVGMGQRLGSVDALKREGVAPISLEQGAKMLERLIAQSRPRSSVVVASRIGESPTLRHRRVELPLLRFLQHPRVYVPGVELVADARVSTGSDPYLSDHIYEGTPLFPGVMGLEAMAQAAMALVESDQVPVMEDVRFDRPVAVADAGECIVRVAALVREDDRVEVVLRCSETQFSLDHFRCFCRFDEVGPIAHGNDGGESTHNGQVHVHLDPHADLYGGVLFQGGRFQRLHRYRKLLATECVADLTPSEQADWFRNYLPNRLMLGDPALRDAAMHAIQACIPHGTLLPTAIDRLRPSQFAAATTVHAVERSQSGDDFVYDLKITDGDGEVVEAWEGLALRRVANAAPSSETWPAALLSTYLSRRVRELTGQPSLALDLSFNPRAGRRARSETGLRVAVGFDGVVYRRPDGKPEVESDRHGSASHAGAFTLVAAADSPAACDLEIVSANRVQPSLPLGADRAALAELVERETGEDRQSVEARVWTAVECLIKVGVGPDAPIVWDSTAGDRWVRFRAGSAEILSCVAAVREIPEPLALAVLVDDG